MLAAFARHPDRLASLLEEKDDAEAAYAFFDAAAQLARMTKFIGAPFDEGRLREAARLSGFERLRDLESRDIERGVEGSIFPTARGTAKTDVRFMNRGDAAASLDDLGPEIAGAFAERFADLAADLGYE